MEDVMRTNGLLKDFAPEVNSWTGNVTFNLSNLHSETLKSIVVRPKLFYTVDRGVNHEWKRAECLFLEGKAEQ